MCLSLSAKNKIGLIDGTIKPPPRTDPRFPMWKCCNDMVLSWIVHSIQPNIARGVIFSDTAFGVWRDLHDLFSQGDDSRIYQIRQEIAECRQGQQSASIYYTKLKALWDELSSYQEPLACSCDAMQILFDREEKERVMQFFMGLNESYSTIRGSILMMSPLPNTRKVHGLILQHERQMEAAARRDIPQTSHAMQAARTSNPPKSSFSPKPLKCTYCEEDTHLVDRCFYLKGFPVGHKWHGKNVKPKNKRGSAHNIELKKEPTNESPTLTADEYKQIMAMLHEKNGNNQPFANATGRVYEEDDWPGQAF
uniref:uncharacterized protein LOC101306260 n=1 Tax=Fragaria vesca subsp. vesca TaxID=101020 RepID=UPI0005C8550B|nr:PREDICTED: uncharacterized protein LOC101306260 [Fragaria vesca subsp. vesca]